MKVECLERRRVAREGGNVGLQVLKVKTKCFRTMEAELALEKGTYQRMQIVMDKASGTRNIMRFVDDVTSKRINATNVLRMIEFAYALKGCRCAGTEAPVRRCDVCKEAVDSGYMLCGANFSVWMCADCGLSVYQLYRQSYNRVNIPSRYQLTNTGVKRPG